MSWSLEIKQFVRLVETCTSRDQKSSRLIKVVRSRFDQNQHSNGCRGIITINNLSGEKITVNVNTHARVIEKAYSSSFSTNLWEGQNAVRVIINYGDKVSRVSFVGEREREREMDCGRPINFEQLNFLELNIARGARGRDAHFMTCDAVLF